VSYEDRISIATPEGVDVQLTLAGVGSRFIAAVIDQLIKWAIILAGGVGLALLGGSGPLGESDAAALAVASFFALVFLVQFTYDVLFEVLASGRTPGKRWTGLRVVRTTGAPVGFVTSAVRNLLRLVDALPAMYAVGIVAVLASSRNQRLGDMAAGTLVVRERRGGRSRDAITVPTSRSWAPPPAWDVSAITPDELATVRRFLERRATLTLQSRARLANELALRLRPKVVGPPEHQEAEAFLEDLSAAKAARL
jgi:uncharacterized RDD family membrane protein YckC